jgi:hypothetical protein
MNHEKYTISISFIVCDGMKDKVLEEIRNVDEYVKKHCLSHAAMLKIKVHHEDALPEDMH